MEISGQPRGWQLLLTKILRLGLFKAVLGITLIAEMMAVVLDWILLHLSPFPPSTYRASLTMAVIIPLIVAPIIGSVIVRLLQQLDHARTELEQVAVHDGLTSLFNRTYFMDILRREVANASRHGTPLSLLLFDVDDFKQVNDRYGHSIGDRALEATARICSALVRQGDVVARYGGEEFVLLLPSTSAEGACQVAEKLRVAIEEMPLEFDGRSDPIHITVSIGVTSFLGRDDTLDALFSRADNALYRSKFQGKNRWALL